MKLRTMFDERRVSIAMESRFVWDAVRDSSLEEKKAHNQK